MERTKKSGKGIKVLLFLILAAAVVFAVFALTKAKNEADSDIKFTMSTNAERIEFLNTQGWIVKPDPISKETVTIPSEWNDVYSQYAELQRSQGFDLEDYKGKEAQLISYMVLNYPGHAENVTANMLIADNRLIGGEITLDEENGFTEPLITKNTQTYLD
ncbi:MAG: DUF4830 domain-containing protein [Oscillospiraceae bacterium]